MIIPWQDISYLQDGNQRQRKAYRALHSLGILYTLDDFMPVLVGTIPIAVDIEDSDLDIVCEAQDLVTFAERVTRCFGQHEGFRIRKKLIKDVPSVVANFDHAGLRVEIFGQPQPVTEQHAYRHMVIEARLLALGGEAARQGVRRLKRAGLKTEPAFASYFQLAGDPYQVLLKLSRLGEEELRQAVRFSAE